MPQEIRVLQCTECKMYQVDLVKKGTKWTCKVCNLKQTFLTEYFRGSGPDCRVLVQELNKNKEISALNTCKFTLDTPVLRREQQILSPQSMKLKQKEFVSKVESDNKEYRGSNVHNHQNKNNESFFEDGKELSQMKWPSSANKRLSMRIDSYNGIKKVCKWDKYL